MQCYTSVVWMHKPDWYRFLGLLIAVIVLALDASSIITSPYAPTKHGVLLAAAIVSIITLVYRLVGQRYFSTITKSYPWVWITPPLEALAVLLLLIGFILVTIGVLSPSGGSCSAPRPSPAVAPTSSLAAAQRQTALPEQTIVPSSLTSSSMVAIPSPVVVTGDDTDDEDDTTTPSVPATVITTPTSLATIVSTVSPSTTPGDDDDDDDNEDLINSAPTTPTLSAASTPAASPSPAPDDDDDDDGNQDPMVTAPTTTTPTSAPFPSVTPTPTVVPTEDPDDDDDISDRKKLVKRVLSHPRALRSLYRRQSQTTENEDAQASNSSCSIDATVIALSVTLFVSMAFSLCTAIREARRITAARRLSLASAIAVADGSVAEKAPLDGVERAEHEYEESLASTKASKGSSFLQRTARFGYILVKGR
ncbi:hypothetical protein H2199_008334 [Coniosporium tulheliwenetii]|uniref:Uncharacterized protein n=1 Tax=Coniosporium tulheliwenetii TaxID=3383036 RepID=A0ACC2YKZ9_9PEZI|nr:hypothetical protein H2199_008334 [Cladosporium sp. JES 115]